MFKTANPIALAAVAALALAATPARAATISDAGGDFLATYEGAPGDYLDILSASAWFDGTSFHLDATLAGAPGAAGSLYVFGIDRGAGKPRLALGVPSIGADVLWDAVAVLFPDGTGRIAAFPAMGAPTITTLPGIVSVSGNSIAAAFPLALLPSTGFAPGDYRFTLWSRQRVNPAADGTNAEIADFAPASGGFVASVPEPATWLTLTAGMALLGGVLRRGRLDAASLRIVTRSS